MSSREEIAQKGAQWNPFEMLLKMRREVPEFRRCCLCLPLRRGLITWGYIQLALNIAAISLLIFIVTNILVIGILIELVFLLFDAAFSIVLIVGSHKRNVNILKAAYIYNIVMLGLLLLSFSWLVYQEIRMASGLLAVNVRYSTILWISLPGFCIHFTIIFVQVYLVLLIRSEKLKLEEQSLEMQFTNLSAAEAQCSMHVSAVDVGRDTNTSQCPDAIECTTSNG